MTTNNGRYVVKVYLLIQVVTLQIISYVSIEVSMTTEMKVRLCNLQECFQVCFQVCFEVCLLVIEGLYSSVQVFEILKIYLGNFHRPRALQH